MSAPEVHETHVSWVVLDGDRAYKLKKPVVFPFLDQSTPERRRAACEAEVRLNRRLAPDVYLGVRGLAARAGGDLVLTEPDAPGVVDYVVEMRRFDRADTLEAQVRSGTAEAGTLRDLGRWVARFHRAAGAAAGGAEPVKRALDDTFATLRTLGEDVTALERWAASALTRHWDELEQRAAAGLVRDGHGDLRAEHVLLGPDGFRAVDCIEFSDALRCIDVGADLSFLVMDLCRLGRADLARSLVAGYREAGGDPGPEALLAFHAAARALVRAKVARLQDADPAGYLALAEQLAWQSRGPLIVALTGVAATGKSTLARALAGRSGLAHLDSDVVRRELFDPVRYGPEHDRRTYEALCARATEEVASAGGVIVEGTFRRREQRRRLLAAAAESGARLLVVECLAPEALLEERAAARRGDVSDAGPAVVRAQLRDREPYDEIDPDIHLPVRGDRPVGALVAAVEDALDGTSAACPHAPTWNSPMAVG